MDDPSHTTSGQLVLPNIIVDNKKCVRTITKHPIYRGIRCRSGKWVCEIREPGKTTRIWLGTYPTPQMAAAAYDVAVLALKGCQNVVLNFPNHVDSYPKLPPSPSREDIRRAAATAAAMMGQKGDEDDDRSSASKGGGNTGNEGGGLIESSSSENYAVDIEDIRCVAATEEAMMGQKGDEDDRSSGSKGGGGMGNEGGTLIGSSSSENYAVDIGNKQEYVDEEELFDFPSLLVNMAEAMMLSPPRINSTSMEDYSPKDSNVDSLWNY
ncbi:ethylene-responsive transcription factor like isoform X1 [Capsicum galapagoense]